MRTVIQQRTNLVARAESAILLGRAIQIASSPSSPAKT